MIRIAREITRFQSKKIIDELFKKARRVLYHPGVHILLAAARADIGHILVIVSRKVGNAPERNKLRRQLRSIFYEEKLFQKGYDCIVITKPGCTNLSYTQLHTLLLKAFAPVSRTSS